MRPDRWEALGGHEFGPIDDSNQSNGQQQSGNCDRGECRYKRQIRQAGKGADQDICGLPVIVAVEPTLDAIAMARR